MLNEITCFLHLHNIEVVIGFEDTVYTTTENSLSTIICILSSDNLGSVVTVNIELVDGSAESEFFCIRYITDC